MHILQVTPYFYPHFGGVESHVLGLSENLIKLGHEVEVVTSRYSRMPEIEKINGIKVTRLPQLINLYNTPVVTAIQNFVRMSHADIVHVHSPPPFTERFAAKGAKNSNKPIVVTHHCDLELKGVFGNIAVNLYQRFLGKYPLQTADRVISTTESYATTSRSLWNIDVDVVPNAVKSVVISTQHSKDVDLVKVKELCMPYIERSIPKNLLGNLDEKEIYINPTGNFVIGGPDGDSGLTGWKIIVDTYGGAAPHGGGAFSGKDPTKVDRSAAYASRYLAKNIVASKIADKCLIQLAYAIGVSKPLSIYVDLFSNDEEKNKHVEKLINENFDLSPRGIREMLGLNKPIYEKSAAYGHFGRDPESNGAFSWENTDKASVFNK